MNTLKHTQTKYHSYIVRFWQDDVHHTWRATLRNVQSGTQRHFQTPQALCQYLEQQGNPNLCSKKQLDS